MQNAPHERGEKFANAIEMVHGLTVWRNTSETRLLAVGPVHTQQQVLRRLDEVYQRFFANVK